MELAPGFCQNHFPELCGLLTSLEDLCGSSAFLDFPLPFRFLPFVYSFSLGSVSSVRYGMKHFKNQIPESESRNPIDATCIERKNFSFC